jgi:hypothetical protein
VAICTADDVRASARVDGAEFDSIIAIAITAAQSMVEHECGVAAGAFDAAPNAGAKQCAIGICVKLIDNPTAGQEDFRALLGSALLDAARTWA